VSLTTGPDADYSCHESVMFAPGPVDVLMTVA